MAIGEGYTLGLDADGGDTIPVDGKDVPLGARAYAGAIRFLQENPSARLHVAGNPDRLEGLVQKFQEHPRMTFFPSPCHIKSDGSVRGGQRKKTALYTLVEQLAEGKIAGVYTQASNKAVVPFSSAALSRIEGMTHCPILTELPTYDLSGYVALDVGATTRCSEQQLYEFALIGGVYAREAKKIARPRIAFLANGEEDNKGTDETRGAIQKLRRHPEYECLGHREPEHCLEGKVDVIVTDGFDGNLAIKVEAAGAKLLGHRIKQRLTSGSMLKKIAAYILKPELTAVKAELSSDRFAAFFMGYRSVLAKGHGKGGADAFYYGLTHVSNAYTSDMLSKVSAALTTANR